MIPERTLRKWRKKALKSFDEELYGGVAVARALASYAKDMESRILRMTQELLDQHLIRKDK